MVAASVRSGRGPAELQIGERGEDLVHPDVRGTHREALRGDGLDRGVQALIGRGALGRLAQDRGQPARDLELTVKVLAVQGEMFPGNSRDLIHRRLLC